MIEPIAFGFNKETSVNNHFQTNPNKKNSIIQGEALFQFNQFVKLLKDNFINVITIKDTKYPFTPDSIFPNNWISFHEGTIVIYPMFAKNRRHERRSDIIFFLKEKGYLIEQIIDYSIWENENRYLEGTGSMVLDREKKIAYATISDRTDKMIFEIFCKDFKYEPIIFHAYHEINGVKKPVYHTNVMMSIGCEYAIICLEAITCVKERKRVIDALSDKELIEISASQMINFAGNVLQLENLKGEKLLVMSKNAYNSLDTLQIHSLKEFNKIITPSIETIEKHGGGGVRCMLAEVF
ncbi:citrulline utilization hydrolase CtlX [Porphyromonas macacae]|nr:arginine deiminase-related protein [Porphyromonas macacae]